MWFVEAGPLYGFGLNNNGQLGLNNKINRNKPTKIPFFSSHLIRIISLSAGDKHTVVLCDDGTSYGFGSNRYCQLGFDSNEMKESSEPIKLPFSSALARSTVAIPQLLELLWTRKQFLVVAKMLSFNLQLIEMKVNQSRSFLLVNLFSLPPDSDLHITSMSSGGDHSIVSYSNGSCFSAGFLTDSINTTSSP